jgi:hypothetical protein
MTNYDLDNAPADSFMGHERDLADALTDDAMDYIEVAMEYDPTEDDMSIFYLYTLLMMNMPAALALTDMDPAEEDLVELITNLQDDANDSSGDYFKERIHQRLAARKTLRRLTDNFARRIEEN